MKASILKLLTKILPTATRTIVRGRQEPPSEARTVDVDEIHSILEAAERGQTDRLFALYRDILSSHTHIRGEFSKRKLAVVGDAFNLQPQDKENENEVALVKDVKLHLEAIPNWFQTISHMLDSTLYPVSVTERIYAPSEKPGWRFQIGEFKAVPHHWLSWPDGVLCVSDSDQNGAIVGTEIPLCPTRYIKHEGDLITSVPDWYGGTMRTVVFWWLFSVMDRDWWTRFLDRFGAPFLVGTYPENDEGAKYSLQNAFSWATKLFGIVASEGAKVEMHQANSSGGGDAFQQFHDTANKEISKVIVGQTLSADGQNLGLGGGQGKQHGEVRDDIRQLDARLLAHTIKTRILAPLWAVNGWETPLPEVSFGEASSEEQAVSGALLASLSDAGLRITDDGLIILSKKVGFPIERDPLAITEAFGLSAEDPKASNKLTLTPGAARRAARQKRARSATAAIIESASPRVAKALSAHADTIRDAILNSDTPEAALSAVAEITADFEHSEVSQLFASVMSSCSCNALLASDDQTTK